MMENQKRTDADISDVKTKILYLGPTEACKLMDSDMRGLSAEEADKRLKKYGKNELAQKKKESMLKKFVGHFTGLMALLLWGGGILAIVSGSLELGIAIFCVNLINGLFSFVQEFKAEKATNALQKMMPVTARVVRGGQEQKIPAADIVPGDIMVLEEGDRISADARVLQSNELKLSVYGKMYLIAVERRGQPKFPEKDMVCECDDMLYLAVHRDYILRAREVLKL